MEEKNLKKLKMLFAAMEEDHLSKSDFADNFKSVVEFVKKIEQKNIEEFNAINDVLRKFAKKIEDENSLSLSDIKSQVEKTVAQQLLTLDKSHKSKMSEIDDKLFTVKDGKDADENAILERLKGEIKIPTIDELKNDLPVMGSQVRDSLEVLQGDDRLDVSAIKGIEGLAGKDVKFVGGSRGIYLYVNGVKKGLMNTLNLVPGANVSMNYTRANGRNDLTISATGASLSILSATGTVDDSNTTFTFISTPVLVVVNGATYRHGHGCSINETTVTLDNPVGTSGDIYAVG
jgi:hypothetical protein